LGGVQPAADRGSGGGAEVFVALRASVGAEQRPAGGADRGGGVVHVEGLCARGKDAGADRERGGVPAALRAARVAQGVREGASLRAAIQPRPGGEAGGVPVATVAVGAGRGGVGRTASGVVAGAVLPGMRVALV